MQSIIIILILYMLAIVLNSLGQWDKQKYQKENAFYCNASHAPSIHTDWINRKSSVRRAKVSPFSKKIGAYVVSFGHNCVCVRFSNWGVVRARMCYETGDFVYTSMKEKLSDENTIYECRHFFKKINATDCVIVICLRNKA